MRIVMDPEGPPSFAFIRARSIADVKKSAMVILFLSGLWQNPHQVHIK